MDAPAPQHPTTQYVNNPFFIATKGINKLFLGAQGVAIMLVIISVLGAFSNFTSRNNQTGTQSGEISAATLPPVEVIVSFAAIGLVALLVIAFISTVLTGMSAYTAANVSLDKTVTFKEAFRAAIANFWGLLWLQVLTGLKVVAWSLLFIIPGIIMAIRYSLANIAFFDKGLRGNAAIQESLRLTKGTFFTTFAGMTLFNMITFGILSELVTTGARAILYRQFDRTPLAERPAPHGLSIATLVVFSLFMVLLMTGLFLLLGGAVNYVQSQTL